MSWEWVANQVEATETVAWEMVAAAWERVQVAKLVVMVAWELVAKLLELVVKLVGDGRANGVHAEYYGNLHLWGEPREANGRSVPFGGNLNVNREISFSWRRRLVQVHNR